MSQTMAWVLLIIAGLLEVGWAIGLKYSEGFSKLVPSLVTVISFAASAILLARATTVLPIGTAYAVWVGVGAFGAAVLGIYLFQESAALPKLFFLGLLLVSIVGLKLTSAS